MKSTTQQRQSISMLDALKHLSVEPGSDSNELFAAVSIASARFASSGGKLSRIVKQLSPSPPPRPSANSETLPTPWQDNSKTSLGDEA